MDFYLISSLVGTVFGTVHHLPLGSYTLSNNDDYTSSDGHLHLKKGSLPNTLPFLRVDCRINTLCKICFQFFKKGSLNPTHYLPFLWVVEPILEANDTSFCLGKVDDLYLYPLFADPKVLKKCSQRVGGRTFDHDWPIF